MPLASRPEKFVLTVFILGSLIAFGPLSIDMYLPALSNIAHDFGQTIETIQYSLTSFFIGLSIGQLFYGPLMDRFGRKPPLYVGLVIYCLASLGCALSKNIEMLVAMRFFQALGSCAGMVGSRAVVRDLFDERDSARVFSLLMLIMGVAPILAPLMGAYISINFGWPLLFVVCAVLSAVCLFCVIFFLPESRGANRSVVLKDSLTVYARIFCNKKFLGFVMAGALVQSGMFAYIADSPFVFIDIFKVKPENYGWIFGSNALGLIGAAQINVQLLKRFHPERILKFAFVILLISSSCMFAASYFNLGFYCLLVPLFVYMSTLGITFPNTTAAALAQEKTRIGSASALLGTLQFSMAALSSALVSIFHNGTSRPMTTIIATCGALALTVFLSIDKNKSINKEMTN